jgi:NTP pyrophosphatase (non-canonical NTP hydrolase)
MSKTIKEWQEEVHALAQEKGWYEFRRSEAEFLMLIASEVFEAFEDVRNHKPGIYTNIDTPEKPEGVAVELADTIIRCLDYAEYRGWNMEEIIQKKHEYNKTRSIRHNGKKL